MEGFLGQGQPWVTALHIIAVITWMTGMFYLPQLYAYHCRAEPGSAQSETFKVMERRLLAIIVNPAMLLSWIFGLLLAAHLDVWGETWFLGKLALLAVMQVMHVVFLRWRRDFAEDGSRRSERFYRRAHDIPGLAMIGIVLLVVVKPF
jgi:putative membrane protein